MNILVCVSRVPDTASRIVAAGTGNSIDKQGIKFILNPYDEFAVEEGLRLREKNGGTVTVLTVSSDAAKEILRTALAMGADKAVIIKTEEEFDSFFAANNIAEYAKSINPDIILLGKQSVDFDSLQMPAIVGELLGMPSIAVVTKLQVDGETVTAEREVEGGKEIVEASLPCIISAQKGLNDPRYPKLPDIMKAKSKPIEEITPLATEKRTEVISLSIPLKQRANKIVGNSDDEIAEVVRLLHEEAKVF